MGSGYGWPNKNNPISFVVSNDWRKTGEKIVFTIYFLISIVALGIGGIRKLSGIQ